MFFLSVNLLTGVTAVKASFIRIVPYVIRGETLIVIIVTAVQYLISASPRYCLVSAGKHGGFAATHPWFPRMH